MFASRWPWLSDLQTDRYGPQFHFKQALRPRTTPRGLRRPELISFPCLSGTAEEKPARPCWKQINEDSSRSWKEDLLKIKSLGFNTVRTWVEWNVGEPRAGEYHLENLDSLLRLADEVGLKVIVQVYVDSAPEWVGAKYPEGPLRRAGWATHRLASRARILL